jgi:hypothetical protein
LHTSKQPLGSSEQRAHPALRQEVFRMWMRAAVQLFDRQDD